MLNVKKTLTKILNRYVTKEYTITTANNSQVSPFGAYATYNIPDAPTGYRIISVTVYGTGSTNPAIGRPFNDEGVFVYSKSAATFTARVVFEKVGGGSQ